MLCATIPKDLMTVNVNLDFQWMDGPAKVTQCNVQQAKFSARQSFLLRIIGTMSMRTDAIETLKDDQ